MHMDCQLGSWTLNEEKAEDKVLICSGGGKTQKKNGEEEERNTKIFFWRKERPGSERKNNTLYCQGGRESTMIRMMYLKMHGSSYQ